MVVLLRKQLEEDILTNWNLRKVLENPLTVNRREGESTRVRAASSPTGP